MSDSESTLKVRRTEREARGSLPLGTRVAPRCLFEEPGPRFAPSTSYKARQMVWLTCSCAECLTELVTHREKIDAIQNRYPQWTRAKK